MERLDSFLSKHYKKIVLSTLILAFVLQIHVQYSRPILSFDTIRQIASAMPLLEGHGVAFRYTSTTDLAQPEYRPYGDFPPGYAFVFAPLMAMTNNYITADFILNLLGYVLLFWTWFKILKLLEPYAKKHLIPVFFLFWAFAFSPWRLMGTTDVLSLGCLSLAAYWSFKMILPDAPQGGRAWAYVAGISVVAFLTCFFRFAYYPMSFTPALLLLGYAILTNKKLLKFALPVLLLTGLMVGGQMVGMKKYVGEVNRLSDRIDPATKRLHWEHLPHYDAIFLNSFTGDWIIYRLMGLDGRGKEANATTYAVIGGMSTFIFLFLLLGIRRLFQHVNRQMSWKEWLRHPVMVVLIGGLLLSLVKVTFMGALSTYFPSSYSYMWTWIMIPRYFVIVFVFAQVTLMLLLFMKELQLSKWLRTGGWAILLVTFSLNVFYWGYQMQKFKLLDQKANMNMLFPPEGYLTDCYALQEYVESRQHRVVVVDRAISERGLYRYAMIGGGSLMSLEDLQASGMKTSEKVEVLVLVNRDNKYEDDVKMLQFSRLNNAQPKLSLDHLNFDLMAFEVSPKM